MSTEHRPCPFCGSAEVGEGPNRQYVGCGGCGASAPVGSWDARVGVPPDNLRISVDVPADLDPELIMMVAVRRLAVHFERDVPPSGQARVLRWLLDSLSEEGP